MTRDIPPVHMQAWVELRQDLGCDDADALLADLVRLFLDSTARNLARLRDAEAAGDGNQVMNSAHGIKGAAATMGAMRLAQVAREIERTAHEGGPVAALIGELTLEFQDVESWCNAALLGEEPEA